MSNCSPISARQDDTQAEMSVGVICLQQRARARALSVLDGVDMAPKSVEGALQALETVAARLRERGDARAVFPDVYAVITRRVKMTVEGQGPAFLEPQWISRLAGLFCEYYLAALKGSLTGGPLPSAWGLAFGRGDMEAASLDALLGINAHINYDLAQGLYSNIVFHGAERDPRLLARYRHDHDLVNSILAAAMPEIFDILAKRYRCPLALMVTRSRGVQASVSRGVMLTLRQWRDRVWDDLSAMLEAGDEASRKAVLARMDRSSALIARAILSGNGVLAAGRPILQGAARTFLFAA